MNNLRLYPGLIDANIEFFNHKDSLKVMSNGSVFNFNEIPMPLYQRLKDVMHSHTDALQILQKWYPESELKQIETFTKCRFGGLDYTPDITEATIQDGEYWDCPLRGACEGEGKVCKALTYNNHALEPIEIKILKLLTTDLTNEVIALEAEVPLGSLHKIKAKLYNKLNVQTKPEATLVAVDLNII